MRSAPKTIVKNSLVWTAICWAAIPLSLAIMHGFAIEAPWSAIIWSDDNVLNWMNTYRIPFLDWYFSISTGLGSLFILVPMGVLASIFLLQRNRPWEAWLLGMGLGGGVLIAQVAKQIFTRPRPELFDPLISAPSGWAFPSGHATQITVFSLCMGIIAFRFSPRLCGIVGIFGIASILAVSISRIYLQVHYLSDVVAGGMIAVLWVIGLYFFLNWIQNRVA